jgi:hypothetical protein
MSACQAQIDRLMGAISAQTGVEIIRSKDGLYLFGSDRDEDLVIGVGPGGDDGLVVLQGVVGHVPADKAAGVLRGVLQANQLLAGMGWPVFAVNAETNAILCILSSPRLDESGIERDAVWMNALITVFLNAAARARDLVETGTMQIPVEGDGMTDVGENDEIFIRL